MKKNVSVYLNDILESIEAIEEYTQDIQEKDFHSNPQLQDAVIRRLEIIGEAVKNIGEDFRNNHSHIPWKKIAGLRDVLIHEYSGVKIERVWKVKEKDLPPLKAEIKKIIKSHP